MEPQTNRDLQPVEPIETTEKAALNLDQRERFSQ
jgi:hypothetical protein